MNAADWKNVEERLSNAYGSVTLRCDGYKVMLQAVRVKPLKYEILPYVNGAFKGTYITRGCPERERFYRPAKTFLYNTAEYKRIEKAFGKREAKKMQKSTTYYSATWPIFGPLKRHLIANNKNIELVEVAR